MTLACFTLWYLAGQKKGPACQAGKLVALGACALVQRQTVWKKINYEYALPKTKESNHEKDEVKDRRNEELRRGLFLWGKFSYSPFLFLSLECAFNCKHYTRALQANESVQGNEGRKQHSCEKISELLHDNGGQKDIRIWMLSANARSKPKTLDT